MFQGLTADRYCFVNGFALYAMSTRPATPRTEPRLRTAHPGGLLVFGPGMIAAFWRGGPA